MDLFEKHVHFIGIGGVSMQALAELIKRNDKAVVSGSDISTGGHHAGNIHADIDVVIINGAISDDNPEVVRAKELDIKILTRGELLAHIETGYINRIAVAGSHGKSTTTAMIGCVLVAGGLNPTVHNGAMPNLILGGKEYFITEACEFKRSFLLLTPTVSIITNIDADHLDCYTGIDDIRAAFDKFAGNSKTVFHCDELCNTIEDIREYERGKYSFSIHGSPIKLGVVGRHNVYNACAAVHVGLHFGIPIEIIAQALENFQGISRRFEKLGNFGNCELITDYAHHPAELSTTISTADDIYGRGNYLIVFQPHTYTRTVALFDDFVKVMKNTKVVLYKTYAAREKPIKGGTACDLATACGHDCFSDKYTLQNYLNKVSQKYAAIILTGAGDINTILKPSE